MVLPYPGPGPELLKKWGFTTAKGEPDEEMWQVHPLMYESKAPTGYPSPYCRHRLIYETTNLYIEETYYWLFEQLTVDFAFNQVYKICDVFSASEQSSFFAVSEQRLSMQQEKASAYLRGISEMVKSLFQIVREIRIIDERLTFYNDSFKPKLTDDSHSTEITLKGIWVDQVEGGVKNASSVFGLSQTVGFTILPDLFFRIEIDDSGITEKIWKNNDKGEQEYIGDWPAMEKAALDLPTKIDKKINDPNFQFNEKVKEVLKRKLVQYYTWKYRTYKELTIRRRFTIKYLRQHYDTIKLYMGWVKPYLRNIKRLQLAQKQGISSESSAELIAGFEGSLIEIELLLQKNAFNQQGVRYHYPCVLMHFVYRTRPQETYVAEGYSRGPAHIGRVDITWRGYVWTEAQIHNFLKMRDEEDLELLGSINESVKEAMEALGDELKVFLTQAGEKIPRLAEKKEDKKKGPQVNALEPLTALMGGFAEIFGAFVKLPDMKQQRFDPVDLTERYKSAQGDVRMAVWQSYKNFKKKHGLISW